MSSRGFGYIKALLTGPAEFPDAVNGVDVGTRRALLTSPGGVEAMSAILALIQGTMPEINWNQIDKTVVSDTSYTYLFSYNDNKQFLVSVSNPLGDFSISVTEYSNLITENGHSAIALENGDELLLEG